MVMPKAVDGFVQSRSDQHTIADADVTHRHIATVLCMDSVVTRETNVESTTVSGCSTGRGRCGGKRWSGRYGRGSSRDWRIECGTDTFERFLIGVVYTGTTGGPKAGCGSGKPSDTKVLGVFMAESPNRSGCDGHGVLVRVHGDGRHATQSVVEKLVVRDNIVGGRGHDSQNVDRDGPVLSYQDV